MLQETAAILVAHVRSIVALRYWTVEKRANSDRCVTRPHFTAVIETIRF